MERGRQNMELKDFLHMKNGDGDLSYSQNQATFTIKTIACITKPMLEGAIKSLLQSQRFHNHLTVADLGCATGSASIELVSTVIELVKGHMHFHDSDHGSTSTMEILVYLNDLPSNDFNTLFREAYMFQDGLNQGHDGDRLEVFFAGVPGSFHNRLFPKRSVHLVHSSYSAHWLSQAPPELYNGEGSPMNKGKVYISDTSPPHVAEAYWSQFLRDFTTFLTGRSEEVLLEGRVLFTLRGRPSDVDGKTWQPWELILFTKAVTSLISKGLIKQEKLDSFDVPFYGASAEDIAIVVEKQGSFAVENVETMKHNVATEYEHNKHLWAEKLARIIRSYTESLVAHHFGLEIVEPLYKELESVTFEFLADDSPEHFTIAVLLIRNT